MNRNRRFDRRRIEDRASHCLSECRGEIGILSFPVVKGTPRRALLREARGFKWGLCLSTFVLFSSLDFMAMPKYGKCK